MSGAGEGAPRDPGATFDGVVAYEAAVRAGGYDRAVTPGGFAWAPKGTGALPPLPDRAVELQGPGGQRLLYVPYTALRGVLEAGARKVGVDPAAEPRFRALASLDGSEPAVNGLWDLVQHLVQRASGGEAPHDHRLDFAARAQVHALLLPARRGKTPVVMSESRAQGTGTEVRTPVWDVGGDRELHRFTGATLTGVSLPALKAERERMARVEAALAAYRKELDAVIGFLEEGG
ncbi:MAG: hypothetical protein R3F59_01005 [Myxococcota bacterium]